jgi:Spy/CpxP family protein refolding chaperone
MTFTGRTGTALLVALIASLCVNLLLAGFLIGGRWHDEPRWRGPFANVPEQARPVMKEVFASHKTEFDARREAVRQARQKVADVLKADPIDQAKLDQALSELMQQGLAMQQFGHQVMVEVARKLTPDQRREMVDSWAKDRFRRKPDPD